MSLEILQFNAISLRKAKISNNFLSAIVMYTDHDDLNFSTMTLRMAMLSAKGLKIHSRPFEHLSQNTDSHLTVSIFF